MQAAPEARIHAAEHGHAAGLLCVQVAQWRCILHQPSAHQECACAEEQQGVHRGRSLSDEDQDIGGAVMLNV